MQRRTVLSGVAALVASTGCARVLGRQPMLIRVMRADEDHVDAADARCELSGEFVAAHPVLERLLSSAETAPVGEWVSTDTDRQTAESLVDDLHDHCEEHGGVYYFGDEAYLVSVRERSS